MSLAAVLEEQGRRPSWVAEKLGISRSTVTLWAQSKRDIPARRLRELAALLGVDELQLGNGVAGLQQNAPQESQRQRSGVKQPTSAHPGREAATPSESALRGKKRAVA